MNLHEYISNEKHKLESAIKVERDALSNLPSEKLHIYKIKDGFSWYVSNSTDKRRKYLPKSERAFAEDLAYKGYLKAKLMDDTEELNAAAAYLKRCNKKERSAEYINRNTEIKTLLESKLKINDGIVEEWLQDKYVGKSRNPESLRYISKAGIKVRSKSEQLIISHLFDAGVPFKYEDRIMINGYNIYPDFTIMNPRTHEIFIWEHFGMMDVEEYRAKNYKKINDYAKLGYNLGEKLLITFETSLSGLDEFVVEFYINHYLL